MSDGTGAPGQAPQGQQPPGPVPPAPYPGAQPAPPAPGGFGPPPASYGPPVPAQQPVVPPVPVVPQPPAPQPVQPQPVHQQPVPQPVRQQPPQPPVQAQPPAPQPPQPVQQQPVQPHPGQPFPQQQMPPQMPQQQWQAQPPAPQPHGEPDWAALADRNEADAKRKGRRRIIGAAVAVVVVGGLIAGGLMFLKKDDGGKKDPLAGPSATAAQSTAPSGKASPTSTPSATATPPEDPSKALWEAATDPAPQDAAALFSALTVTVNGATWNRTVVSLDSPCWDGNSTVGGLGKALGDQGCRQVLRATYVSGDSAVTVGVAVFDHKQQAETALKNYVGHLKGAAAPGSPAFCTTPGCTNTKGTLGRYGYFTVEGSAKGGNTADATATAAAVGFGEHVKNQLLQRVKAGAPAAAPTG
ncbi:hypothetical protein OH807_25575 [Kitasatospora sp. NBC_01560]|uniref:hypothetical protein n=1 Tax=Kitasatospora sp. NBC_01560 TaxID=2975965 RepID=UPI0038682FFD